MHVSKCGDRGEAPVPRIALAQRAVIAVIEVHGVAKGIVPEIGRVAPHRPPADPRNEAAALLLEFRDLRPPPAAPRSPLRPTGKQQDKHLERRILLRLSVIVVTFVGGEETKDEEV